MEKLKKAKWRILALILLGGLSFLSVSIEEYHDLVLKSAKFMVFFVAVFIGCIFTALYMNGKTKFFIWLLVFGFFIGLLTQMVGTNNSLWVYNGTYKSYVFAGFSWAFAAASMLGLSLLIKKYIPEVNGKLYNVLALVILLLIILIFLGESRTKVFLNFPIYYLTLFTFAIVATYGSRFSTLSSLILAAWIMGIVSEYMGSSIGLWKFCHDLEHLEVANSIECWSPPPYLTFGCWPLEFLTQVGLSSFISQQNILKDQ
jgi:hypothetical protein